MSAITSSRVSQLAPWVAGLILVAGVVAFTVVYFGNTAESVESKVVDRETGAAIVPAQRKSVELDPEARQVAGKFIVTAVARENLGESWALTHPDLRQGLTRQQWLTGNIPVQFYPAGAIDGATFKIDESYPDETTLEVALIPKDGEDVKPQIFYITLKKTDGKWQVSYFAPRATPAVPTTG